MKRGGGAAMNLKGEIKKYAAGSWKKRGLGYGKGGWERGREVVRSRQKGGKFTSDPKGP